MNSPIQKRIAIYTSSFPPKSGGIASAHYNLFNELSLHHTVKAFVFRDPERDGENVVRGKPWPGMAGVFKGVLRKIFRKPIHVPLKNCDEIAETAASVIRMNAKLSEFAPDYIICPDHYLPALALRKPEGAKLVWMARHNYLRFANQRLCPPPDFQDLHLAHRLERRAMKKADVLVSPSRYMLDLIKPMFGDNLPSYVIKNFVREDHISEINPSPLRKKLKVDSDFRLVYVPSGGAQIKGARYTFEIVRRLGLKEKIGVYIPGNIPSVLKHELQSLEGNTAVYLPGHVPYERNLANVAACDLTVSPTLVENLSNALIESIMLGIPVVTFDTGGNKEFVLEGKTGSVVPYGDVEALIQAAGALLKDGKCLERLQSNCRTTSRKIVDSDQIVNTYNDIVCNF